MIEVAENLNSSIKMSKRPGFQYRMPRAKMPKLSITVSSSQRSQIPSTSAVHRHQPNQNYARIPQPEMPKESVDLWGDEDDELVMLASQVAEKVEANAEQVLTQAMGFHNASINFEKFRKEVQASTQLPEEDDFVNEFHCDTDDVILFADLPEIDEIAVQPIRPSTSKEKSKRPTIEIDRKKSNEGVSVTAKTSMQQKSNSETSKLQICTTFYSNQMRDHKKDMEALQENFSKMNEKLQTKEGEVTNTFLVI